MQYQPRANTDLVVVHLEDQEDLVEVEGVSEEALVVDLAEVKEGLRIRLVELAVPWKKLFQVLLGKTILYLQMYLIHHSCVMAKLKVVTMLIQKLSVKHFTFVEVMGMEV